MEGTFADSLWVIICSVFVFMMQPGFTALETGFTRSKNAINVAMKNLSDFLLSSIIFWFIGFGLMFGTSAGGLWGTSDFLNNWHDKSLNQSSFFLFQTAFCATAATLTSGAVAERMRFVSFLYMTIVLAAVIYPLFGHWSWNSDGWLKTMGFYDFAGASVVHSVGGWVALAAILLVGPRTGRFDEQGKPRHIPGSNIAVSTLGFLLIWIGWLGFNGGSTGKFSSDVALIIINTIIGGAAGGVTIILYSYGFKRRIIKPQLLINSILAGLVAVTASANIISSLSAFVIGSIAAVAMLSCTSLLIKYRVDDAIGVVPVHLAGGIWGTLAVPFFANLELASGILPSNNSIVDQLLIQITGIVACGLWAFGVTYLVLFLISRVSPLRVDKRSEKKGLNIVEHGATTEILDFMNALNEIEKTSDLSVRAPVEPFTEIGQIAQKYNTVMDRLQLNAARTNCIIQSLRVSIITFSRETLKIISLNPAAVILFGVSEDDLIGKNITSLFNIPEQSKNLTIQQLMAAKKSTAGIELIARCAGNLEKPVRISVSETGTVHEGFYSAVVIDVTEQEKASQALKRAKIDAEQALDELKSTQFQLNEIEKIAALGELVSGVAQEVNTPISISFGAASYLSEITIELKKKFDENTLKKSDLEDFLENTRENMQLLLSNSGRAADLIHTIQQKQSGPATDPTADPAYDGRRVFNLKDYIEESLLNLNPKFKNTRHTIQIDCPENITLNSYPEPLSQVITNLISNSLTHAFDTEIVGLITIKVDHKPERNWVDICYSDNGAGISEDIIEKIFDPFYATKTNHGGRGLGLNLVYNIIASKLKGSISVSSEKGKGTTFNIGIPTH